MSNLNLMVGDWVMINDNLRKIYRIDLDKDGYSFNYLGSNFCQPIPLTPEILEKIGFEKHPNRHDYTLGSIRLCLCWDNNWRFVYDTDLDSCPIINHLHTLQQLIRLLTGKEIEIEW